MMNIQDLEKVLAKKRSRLDAARKNNPAIAKLEAEVAKAEEAVKNYVPPKPKPAPKAVAKTVAKAVAK